MRKELFHHEPKYKKLPPTHRIKYNFSVSGFLVLFYCKYTDSVITAVSATKAYQQWFNYILLHVSDVSIVCAHAKYVINNFNWNSVNVSELIPGKYCRVLQWTAQDVCPIQIQHKVSAVKGIIYQIGMNYILWNSIGYIVSLIENGFHMNSNNDLIV